MTVNSLGIYEKALPQDLSWKEKFNLVRVVLVKSF